MYHPSSICTVLRCTGTFFMIMDSTKDAGWCDMVDTDAYSFEVTCTCCLERPDSAALGAHRLRLGLHAARAVCDGAEDGCRAGARGSGGGSLGSPIAREEVCHPALES